VKKVTIQTLKKKKKEHKEEHDFTHEKSKSNLEAAGHWRK
jgi:hypothetical protein